MTGVTVALLAVGLVAAGFGTAVFLRNTLIANLDTRLQQTSRTDVASSLFDITIRDGKATFTVDDTAVSPDYFVAIYGPEGEFLESTGGSEDQPPPVFPEEYFVKSTVTRGVEPFSIPSSEEGAPFHASVSLLDLPNANVQYTQMLALPTASVNQIVATFVGIYLLLAVITIIAGALLTRWLVTLTFRGLGQVETTAMAIAAGDFSQRMTDIEPRTEVGKLKTAINTMLGRVDASLAQRDATVQQMRRFIGDASHELRTPLVTVRGYAELYRMGAISTDDDVAQAMERIEKEAMRMGFLVEDLLALARLDERRDVIIAPVDLRPVARDAALDVRATSPNRPVTVIDTTVDDPEPTPTGPVPTGEVPVPRRRSSPAAITTLLRRKPRQPPSPNSPPSLLTAPLQVVAPPSPIVLGDENRVRQVVANLLGNARRFTSDDSPIELRVGVDAAAGMGWIEVADHGDGIPDQIKEKIFQRFWRADTSRARETGGTGLGLSIVASIVDALHGSVAVFDTPGGGATFRVCFPLEHERDAEEHLLIETQPIERITRPTP